MTASKTASCRYIRSMSQISLFCSGPQIVAVIPWILFASCSVRLLLGAMGLLSRAVSSCSLVENGQDRLMPVHAKDRTDLLVLLWIPLGIRHILDPKRHVIRPDRQIPGIWIQTYPPPR